ncbi:MAG: cytochrome c biogenesis protein ResB [Planctomycetes bacterium]|nr:cytochrome c biogenesis protein ResB [Planctomycetota bacterium]
MPSGTSIIDIAASRRLSLVLVALLIGLSLVGAVVPQEGMHTRGDIASWQDAHPVLGSAFITLGFFRIFHSWSFMLVILVLAINTLACTLKRFLLKPVTQGSDRLSRIGSIVFHVSIIGVLAGGFLSSSMRLDGYIGLTEGETFVEQHDQYLRIVEGPLRPERHTGFTVRLVEVITKHHGANHLVELGARLAFASSTNPAIELSVGVNKPVEYGGLVFTQDERGFSPRTLITDAGTGAGLVNSFFSLKTFRTPSGPEYRDFLPLPFLEQRTILNVYPSHSMQDGRAIKTGDELRNPLLVVETGDDTESVTEVAWLLPGATADLGAHRLTFAELRQWSTFKVVDDPGYPVVAFFLWTGVAGLAARYATELARWIRSG